MKKKISVIVLILLLGSGVSLFFAGCAGTGSIPEDPEIKYDIQGQWTISRVFGEGSSYSLEIVGTFTGDKKNGTMVPESGISGIYHVGGEDGVQVEFHFSYYENGNRVFENFQGKFINEDYMKGSGTIVEYINDIPNHRVLAWGATRN